MGASPLSDAEDGMAVLSSRGGFGLETRLSLAYPNHVASDQKCMHEICLFQSHRKQGRKEEVKKCWVLLNPIVYGLG